jgi:D-sedoheptulose 7-phosphate isomerase
MTKDIITFSLNEAAAELERFISDPSTVPSIEAAALAMEESIRSGGKIIACGNGGSLCDAMHFAEELTGRYRSDRKPLPAIAIDNPGHITCTANDFGFEDIFSRPVEALGRPGDVLLGISTSGSSANVIKAAEAAKSLGMKVVTLTGKASCPLADISDVCIAAPRAPWSDRIQEIHIKVIHILVEILENRLADIL